LQVAGAAAATEEVNSQPTSRQSTPAAAAAAAATVTSTLAFLDLSEDVIKGSRDDPPLLCRLLPPLHRVCLAAPRLAVGKHGGAEALQGRLHQGGSCCSIHILLAGVGAKCLQREGRAAADGRGAACRGMLLALQVTGGSRCMLLCHALQLGTAGRSDWLSIAAAVLPTVRAPAAAAPAAAARGRRRTWSNANVFSPSEALLICIPGTNWRLARAADSRGHLGARQPTLSP
jgi:hypothetical protein